MPGESGMPVRTRSHRLEDQSRDRVRTIFSDKGWTVEGFVGTGVRRLGPLGTVSPASQSLVNGIQQRCGSGLRASALPCAQKTVWQRLSTEFTPSRLTNMDKSLDREVPWHACDQLGGAMLSYRSDQTSSLLEAATRLYQKPESLIVRFWLRKSV